jgi:DNA-binding response OmpR family regulator
MSDKRTILIVEDDEALRETLREHLAEGQGFAVHPAATLADADKAINTEELRIDAIILDIGLPDGDGLDYCIRLRKRGHKMPIIILTGVDSEDKVAQGLDSGANDYITKPFRSNELAARLRTQLRLYDEREDAIVSVGPFIFRPSKKLLQDQTKKKAIRLTDKENMILKYLVRAASSVDRLTLLNEVWGYNVRVTTHTVETHIYRLRQKIEADPSNPRLLVLNQDGYALRPEGSPTSGSSSRDNLDA